MTLVHKIIGILLLGMLFGWGHPLLAQDSAPMVTVYLKNGQVIKGHMRMSIHEDYLTLEHDSLSRTQLAFQNVKKIYFGQVPNEEPEPYFERKPGFFHLAELGLQIGNNDYEANTTLSVHTVNGYAFSPYLLAGLGFGFDRYGSISTLPLYASIRGLIMDRKVSPFYFANLGGGFAWPTNEVADIDYERTHGGLYLHGGLGYQINLARSALLLTAGYKVQKTDFAYDFVGWGTESHIEEKRTIRRLTLGFGYTF